MRRRLFLEHSQSNRQGPHEALIDIELITIGLGAMGNFHAVKTS